MIDRLQHQLEINGDAATLYLAGGIGTTDIPALREICSSLPARVMTLRVDLHAMRAPGPDAVSAVRAMLHDWRAERRGEFRLSLCTSHFVATYREGMEEAAPARFGAPVPASQHALMATFL